MSSAIGQPGIVRLGALTGGLWLMGHAPTRAEWTQRANRAALATRRDVILVDESTGIELYRTDVAWMLLTRDLERAVRRAAEAQQQQPYTQEI